MNNSRTLRIAYLRNIIPLLQQEITKVQYLLSESPSSAIRKQAQNELAYKLPNLKARIDERDTLEAAR
jgi:hypothetical protein